MERRCESELMEDGAQARAYADADFSGSDRSVVDGIAALLASAGGAGGQGLSFVDLGCGPGNISLRLARRWPAARVLGIDGSEAMLAIAEERRRDDPTRLAGLRFQRAVLPCGSLPACAFAVVVSNSLLHHLHDPQVLWASVRQLAAPGAWIFIRDLRRPPGPQALEALVRRHAEGAPAVLRRDFANSLRAAFSADEVAAQLRQAGLQHLALRELEDRYLEVSGRLR
jgi:SAM-dependent methyltransferase